MTVKGIEGSAAANAVEAHSCLSLCPPHRDPKPNHERMRTSWVVPMSLNGSVLTSVEVSS